VTRLDRPHAPRTLPVRSRRATRLAHLTRPLTRCRRARRHATANGRRTADGRPTGTRTRRVTRLDRPHAPRTLPVRSRRATRLAHLTRPLTRCRRARRHATANGRRTADGRPTGTRTRRVTRLDRPHAPRTLQARDEASSPYTSPYTLQAGPAPCHRRAVGRRAWEVARRAWAGAVLQGACRRREEAWEEAWEAEAAHQAVCRRRAALARLA